MYPQPFKRKNRKQYYFNYLDPITKKRVMKSTGLEKKKLAQDMIIEYMNKINGMTSVEAGSLRELLTPWLSEKTNPRFERYQAEGKQYGVKYAIDIARLLGYVIKYPIADMQVASISRGVVLNFRKELNADTKFSSKPRNNIPISVFYYNSLRTRDRGTCSLLGSQQ